MVFVLFALIWFVPHGYRGVWATATGCVLAQYWVLRGTWQIQYHFGIEMGSINTRNIEVSSIGKRKVEELINLDQLMFVFTATS